MAMRRTCPCARGARQAMPPPRRISQPWRRRFPRSRRRRRKQARPPWTAAQLALVMLGAVPRNQARTSRTHCKRPRRPSPPGAPWMRMPQRGWLSASRRPHPQSRRARGRRWSLSARGARSGASLARGEMRQVRPRCAPTSSTWRLLTWPPSLARTSPTRPSRPSPSLRAASTSTPTRRPVARRVPFRYCAALLACAALTWCGCSRARRPSSRPVRCLPLAHSPRHPSGLRTWRLRAARSLERLFRRESRRRPGADRANIL
mmetsp:Transcript_5188/g.15198  ORF Transcript_5188/g.15198 Transcript_5188/m.15198 type:complete len:261 (-) Transcript_5188:93-875(-)